MPKCFFGGIWRTPKYDRSAAIIRRGSAPNNEHGHSAVTAATRTAIGRSQKYYFSRAVAGDGRGMLVLPSGGRGWCGWGEKSGMAPRGLVFAQNSSFRRNNNSSSDEPAPCVRSPFSSRLLCLASPFRCVAAPVFLSPDFAQNGVLTCAQTTDVCRGFRLSVRVRDVSVPARRAGCGWVGTH